MSEKYFIFDIYFENYKKSLIQMFAIRKLVSKISSSASQIDKFNTIQNVLFFSSKRPIRRPPIKSKTRSGIEKTSPPPAAVSVEDSWVGVKDVSSGQIYWWNQVTDETTQLGAPKPTTSSAISYQTQQGVVPIGGQQQSGGMMSGLGGIMAQGMAFGVGSSVAHSVMGNMFGGSSSGSGDAPVDDGGSGDEWDI